MCRPPQPAARCARSLSQLRLHDNAVVCAHPCAPDESSTQLFPCSGSLRQSNDKLLLCRRLAGMARCVWQHGRAAAGELSVPISGTELMDAVSHTQSGAPVGVRSLGFAADAVRFALDLLSQSRAEASPTLFAPCRLDHARVGWRVLRFLGKTFFAASLELTRRRPPSDASGPETLPSGKRFWLEPVLWQSSDRRDSAQEHRGPTSC